MRENLNHITYMLFLLSSSVKLNDIIQWTLVLRPLSEGDFPAFRFSAVFTVPAVWASCQDRAFRQQWRHGSLS